jgi:hypothetical protein
MGLSTMRRPKLLWRVASCPQPPLLMLCSPQSQRPLPLRLRKKQATGAAGELAVFFSASVPLETHFSAVKAFLYTRTKTHTYTLSNTLTHSQAHTHTQTHLQTHTNTHRHTLLSSSGRVPSKASKPLAPELSVAATAAAHGTAFVRAVPALNIKVSKEKGVQYANDQTSQDLGTHIYPSLPPSSLSDSPPLILTPCLHPPDPSHTPYLSTATHTTQSPSLSQPAHSPALSTQQTGQPAHSPAVSSQISPGGVHMSPSSQAGWVGGEAPQGHHHRHTHHTPVSPPHPLSHHLSSSANLYDPSDQRQQLHQNAAPSSPLPAQLASPQAPVQLQGGQPAANAALGVTPLKMGKGSYSRWEGSQHEGTEGASSDDEVGDFCVFVR